jgi:hypothetical protein
MGICVWRFSPGQLECIHCGRILKTSSRTAAIMCPVSTVPAIIPTAVAPRDGPGTELAKLLAGWPFYLTSTPDCPCREHAEQMNAWGPDECERQLPRIVAWLRDQASRRGLPFSDLAARLLIRRAIAKARKPRHPL